MTVTRERLIDVITELCPDMLSHEKFMHAATCVFCEDLPNDRGALDSNEYDAWHKLSDKLHTATVGQVIEYLKKSFKPDDKLCYMDCVEGCRNDCTYITKDQLGERFFYKVKTFKARERSKYPNETDEDLQDLFPYVNDDDVIVG